MKAYKNKRLRFSLPDRSAISLAEIISAHLCFSSKNSLSNNLGDGFLIANNPIFRNIRIEVLNRGYRFTTNDFCHYFSYPLMCLDNVIAAKRIPYRENFYWLNELEKQRPGLFSLIDLKRGGLQFNYLFHESAHCVAHSVFFGEKKHSNISKNKDSLLPVLLGEAFANSAECLASLFAEGEIGSYFLDANCHFRSSEKEAAIIWRYVNALGFEAVAKVLLCAFLYSNFMYQSLKLKEERLIKKMANISNQKNIKPLLEMGLSLCEQFRSDTTQLHLMKMGYKGDLNSLTNYDPLEKILKKKSLSNKFQKLVDILIYQV